MNKRSIDTARDQDLRLSPQAMQRAALRARALAAQTGTALVVSRNGVIERIDAREETVSPSVQEPHSDYRPQN